MNSNRVKQILSSSADIEVKYNGSSVWIDQLNEDGRLLVPIGDRLSQTLTRFRKSQGVVISENICSCVFVPLRGERGWA